MERPMTSSGAAEAKAGVIVAKPTQDNMKQAFAAKRQEVMDIMANKSWRVAGGSERADTLTIVEPELFGETNGF